MFRRPVAAIAALALTTVPMAAQAAPRPAARTAAATEESQAFIGTTWILAAIGLGLVIWGIIELTDDDEPASP